MIAKLLTSGFFGALFVFAYKITNPAPIDSRSIRVWTAKDLGLIARDGAILGALESLRVKTATENMKDAVDRAALRDFGDVLPGRFGWKPSVFDSVVNFAKTENPVATCSAPSSAGADGLDECVSRCERGSFALIGGKKPHAGGCYALCSLAVAPCNMRPFTWTRWVRAAEFEIEGLLHESFYVLLVVSLPTGDITEFGRGLIQVFYQTTLSQAVVLFAYTYVVDSSRVTLLLFWAVVLCYKYAVKCTRTFQTRPQIALSELEQRRASVNESEDAPKDEVAASPSEDEDNDDDDDDDNEAKAEDDHDDDDDDEIPSNFLEAWENISSSSSEEIEGIENDEIAPYTRATGEESPSSSSAFSEEEKEGMENNDVEMPPHIRATSEESSSSSSTSPEEENEGTEDDDDERPAHIRATWEESSSSSSSSSEEDDEDIEDDDWVNLPESEEEKTAALRRKVLESKGRGLGDLSSLGGKTGTDLVRGKKLGEGGYGLVHALALRAGPLKAAVMEVTDGRGLALKESLKRGHKCAKREIRVLQSLMPFSHQNIINVFKTSFVENTMVMEAMFSDLHSLIGNDTLLQKTSHPQMIGLCRGGARGLQFLHEKGIVHGDVKLANFLVSEDRRLCKVTDFGSAGPRNTTLSTATLPTLSCAAPEAVGAYKGAIMVINEAMDVWSMAIVILQAVLREPYGPMSEDVLSQHDERLLPPDGVESVKIAQRNYDELCDRADGTGRRADVKARGLAKLELKMLRYLYSGMSARLKGLDEYLLSRVVWKGMADLVHETEVKKVLASMLDPDPRRRISMATVASALSRPRLWSIEGHAGRGIEERTLRPKATDALHAIDQEVSSKTTDEPSWLAVAEATGNDWWKRVPVPERVEV